MVALAGDFEVKFGKRFPARTKRSAGEVSGEDKGATMEMLNRRQWLSWLIRVRLVIITFLLGIQLVIQQVEGFQNLTIVRVPMKYFLAVVVFWYLLDLIYAILLKFNADDYLQAYLQIILDATMVTLVIYFTGGLDSYFYFLYPLMILMGSIVLTRMGTYLLAALCFVQAWVILELPYYGIFPSYGLAYPDLSSLRMKIVTNMAAFLAVAYLAGRLAEILRKTGVELQEKAGKLEDLKALNQDIVESMRGGLVTTDLEGRVLTLNTPGAEILNASFESLAGKPVESLFPGIATDGRPDLTQPRREIFWRDAAGEEKFLGFSVAPLGRSGETIGYVYNFQDVTLMKQLEREVQFKDRMAAIGRMAAAIAHEIRNPLASIAGSVKLFSGMASMNHDQQRLIGIVLKESERLNRIITDFLLYAREKTFQFSPVNVVEILEETLTLLQNHPKVDSHYHIEKHFPPEPVWASLDTDRMRQVFWNLGENALKAMPSGGVLTVALAAGEEHLEIRFSDTGVGLTPQQAEKVFEPFQSDFVGGTGLGLAIAYQIIQAHQGTIRAESAGQGCTFSIELPMLVHVPNPPVPAATVHG
ncbi:MAG: PAS domain-containing protein [Acidobacteria bacterium]|nr:PAS domain-containing protein [Acidobacteriota bacterium]